MQLKNLFILAAAAALASSQTSDLVPVISKPVSRTVDLPGELHGLGVVRAQRLADDSGLEDFQKQVRHGYPVDRCGEQKRLAERHSLETSLLARRRG